MAALSRSAHTVEAKADQLAQGQIHVALPTVLEARNRLTRLPGEARRQRNDHARFGERRMLHHDVARLVRLPAVLGLDLFRLDPVVVDDLKRAENRRIETLFLDHEGLNGTGRDLLSCASLDGKTCARVRLQCAGQRLELTGLGIGTRHTPR